MSGTFLYFAYGSNLLAKRIHINNPSAVRVGCGKLPNYQLDFVTYSKRWKGASATIIERPGRHVWGAVWQIGSEHKASLDDQEGVAHNIYYCKQVDIFAPDGKVLQCYVYEQCNTPIPTDKIDKLAEDRKPSQVYLNIMQKGAQESNLPIEYQHFLRRIPHNGYTGEVEVGTDLHLT